VDVFIKYVNYNLTCFIHFYVLTAGTNTNIPFKPAILLVTYFMSHTICSLCFLTYVLHLRSQNSSVSKETGYRLEGPDSIPGRFSSPQRPYRPEAHSASNPVGTAESFSGGKALRGEVDHSHPCNAEMNKGGATPPMPHMSSRCSA
jgi:hypothetical protein